MVSTVAAGPPLYGALPRACACECQGVLEEDGGVVGAVGTETVVACGDAEACDVVVEDGEKEGLGLEGRVVGTDDANEGGEGEEEEGLWPWVSGLCRWECECASANEEGLG